MPPARRLPIAFDDRATAVVAPREETPELAAEVVRPREPPFSGGVEETGESYGLDEYDEGYRLLVVIDEASADVAAGMGLEFGKETPRPTRRRRARPLLRISRPRACWS